MAITINPCFTYVLIHGAMHGEWCFKELKFELEKYGHKVITFDLPGCGNDETEIKNVNLNLYVKKTINKIIENTKKEEKVILIGHSMGGITISQVSELLFEKIQCIIYLCAFYVENNKCLLDYPQSKYIDKCKENEKYLFIKNDDLIKYALYNCCEDYTIEYAKNNIKPQIIYPALEKVFISNEKHGNIEKYYIKTLKDRMILPEDQNKMIINYFKKENIIELNTDHSPFLSMPKQLADVFNNIGKNINHYKN